MKSYLIVPAIIFAATLSACSGGEMIASDYDWVKQQEFPYGGMNWQIMDRAAEHRLMIRPPLGEMWGSAAEAGVTFSDVPPDQRPKMVAAEWLKSKGNCNIVGVDNVGAIARQVRYECH